MPTPSEPSSTDLALYGRSSSHYTRLVRVFAEEAGLALPLIPIHDLRDQDAAAYGGHPALKLPVLAEGEARVFGAETICRRLRTLAAAPDRLILPEHLADPDLANAQEVIWSAMQAQVQLAFGIEVARLPADNVYFAKARTGLQGSLDWLGDRWPGLEARLPPRAVSLIEASLFCLIEHLAFRPMAAWNLPQTLGDFAAAFGARDSARATPYGFDLRPRQASEQ